MNQQQLFEKYSISPIEILDEWTSNDDWDSVELYRLMHGHLPANDDMSLKFVLDFLDTYPEPTTQSAQVSKSDSNMIFDSFTFHTQPHDLARKMIYRYADLILEELTKKPLNNGTN